MGSVRRSHALTLGGGGAALLLLLLAHLLPAEPPAPAPTPTPAHTRSRTRATDHLSRATAVPSTTVLNSRSSSSIPPPAKVMSSARAPSAAAGGAEAGADSHTPTGTHKGLHNDTHTYTNTHKTIKKDTQKEVQVVRTKDLYEAGHLWVHPELCPRLGADIQLLILITSAPSHTAARTAIRLTWGHFVLRRDIAIAFVLGRPPDKFMKLVTNEDALYGDIIMGASWDSYSNLTLKSLSMLEWAAAYCPRARCLLKTDDDMFINVPRLLAFIAHPSRANATKTIWGKIVTSGSPGRIPNSKYYLSRVQYPNKVLPDFATGPAYLLTSDAVGPLLAAAPAMPYVRLEDVFVTGVLADKVGVRRQHANEFYNKKMAAHPCLVKGGVSIHMVQYHEQFDLWRKLLDGKTKCRKPPRLERTHTTHIARSPEPGATTPRTGFKDTATL